MKKLMIIPALVLLASCGPKSGDVYEHELSKERIEILDVGQCAMLYRFQEKRNAYYDTALSYSKERKIARGYIKNPVALYRDSSATCVSYGERAYHRVYNVIRTKYIIEQKEDFLQDHLKVN